MNKILNIPNTISLIRIFVLSPFVGYLVYVGENYWAIVAGAVIIASDIADGYLARRLKQQTTLGTTLDAMGDNVCIAVLVFIFLYKGYMGLEIFAMFVVHRLTRGALAMYVGMKTKGIYTPKYIKATGFIPMIYIFFIPVLFHTYGKLVTDITTWAILLSTYLILLGGVVSTIFLVKKGKIRSVLLEKVKIKDAIEDKERIKEKIRRRKSRRRQSRRRQ